MKEHLVDLRVRGTKANLKTEQRLWEKQGQEMATGKSVDQSLKKFPEFWS